MTSLVDFGQPGRHCVKITFSAAWSQYPYFCGTALLVLVTPWSAPAWRRCGLQRLDGELPKSIQANQVCKSADITKRRQARRTPGVDSTNGALPLFTSF